jgi:hypothetical protein
MSQLPDGSRSAALEENEAQEERFLERHRSARRLAEMSWREFFVSLGVRTLVIIFIVLAVVVLLRLISG